MTSIRGHEIVLSLSQEPIQRQLQVLYENPLGEKLHPLLDDDGNPDPNAVVKQIHLIDHDLIIKSKDGDTLEAHILCPKINLSAGTAQQAGLGLTFCDSPTLVYHESGQEVPAVNLDGWSVGWLCNIATAPIKNIMEDLISPSKLRINKNPIVLDPVVQKKLEKAAVDSRDYMISSLFCVLESSSLASSFTVTDHNGQAQDPATSVYRHPKGLMMFHLDAINKEATPRLPTTRNPFILGYGVVQQPKSIGSLGGHGVLESFVPKRFDVSVTPATEEAPAALNYLITTYGDHYSDRTPQGLNPLMQKWRKVADGFTGVMAFFRKSWCCSACFGTSWPNHCTTLWIRCGPPTMT
jgi:phage-related protein